MFTFRQSLFLAAFACTAILIERTVTVMIADPGRRLIITFLLALAGVIVSWVAYMLRTHFERFEHLALRQAREDQAAITLAAVRTPRLHSVERN